MSDKVLEMGTPAEYVVVQLALPQRPTCSVGVLLLDRNRDRLYPKLRDDWSALAGEEDSEVLAHLQQDFETKIAEVGGEAFLRYLEDTLSNTLLVTGRETVQVTSFSRSLERLFDEHVQKSKVVPFVTHLPLYGLRAAATRFGEDMEVEAEDWVPAPATLRLTPDMFVAKVVGRSMEPLIPDGSLCIFRANVVGSRQGKHLLVQRLGVTGTSAEFTVKRYSSRKVPKGDQEWEHSLIRLEPLNPEFEPMEFRPEEAEHQFRVIGEFVAVLE